MDISDKKIIIFGASSDIAFPVINYFIDNNTDITLVSRNPINDQKNVETILISNYKDELFSLIDDLDLDNSQVCAINFIGSMILKPLHLLKEVEMEEIIEVNFMTNYRILNRLLKKNMTNFSYVAFSSVAANYGLANHEAISAAKAANEGLLRSCASSYGHKSYRFNCIAPSLIESKLTNRIVGSDSGRQAAINMNPLKKIGSPEDLTECILWLLSEDSKFVTGQTINIGGGLNNINSRIVQ